MAALSGGREQKCFFFEADQLTKGVVQRAGQYFSNALLTEGRRGGAFGTQVIV